MGNLDFYESVRKPPAEALKDFDNGNFKGSDINTMWRIKVLTERYGPCGIGWYYTIDKKWTETSEDGTVMSFSDISLYIKENGEWSMPIAGTGGNRQAYKTKSGYLKISDECYKMATTDAFGNACRSLGIGADVYWANDVTKYTIKTDDATDITPEEKEKLEAAKRHTALRNEYTKKVKAIKGQGYDVQAHYQKSHDGKSVFEATEDELKDAIKKVDDYAKKKDPTT